MIKLIKKVEPQEIKNQVEKPVLKKAAVTEQSNPQNLPIETIDTPQTTVEREQGYVNNTDPYSIPKYEYTGVQSIENSGWQVSDIWRELRVDDFCGSW